MREKLEQGGTGTPAREISAGDLQADFWTWLVQIKSDKPQEMCVFYSAFLKHQ